MTCIITTSPNEVMMPIHDRMPVIVAPENWRSWLSGSEDEIAGLITSRSELAVFDLEP
jgi:putative SOS response-associated peptidase YedK